MSISLDLHVKLKMVLKEISHFFSNGIFHMVFGEQIAISYQIFKGITLE